MRSEEYRAAVASEMSEDALQTRVLLLAGSLGWLAYHTHDSRRSQAGWPDLVLAHKKRPLLLIRELKSARGKVTPDQERWLALLAGAGVDAGVWRPVDLVEGRIERALRVRRAVRGVGADEAARGAVPAGAAGRR